MSIVWVDDVTQLDAEHMNQLEQITRKGIADGYAPLGADGLVPPAHLPPAADLSGYQLRSEEGVPNGYASLDLTGRVPLAQMPDVSGTYQTRVERGVPDGYAALGPDGKVPAGQLPPFPDLSATYQPLAQKNQPSGYLGIDPNRDISFDATQEILWPLGGKLGQRAGGGVLVTGVLTAADIEATNTLIAKGSQINLWPTGLASPVIDLVRTVTAGATPGLRFGSGAAAVDVSLYRTGAGALRVAAGDGVGPGLLRATGQLLSEDRIHAEVGEATEVRIGRDAAGTKAQVLLGGDAALIREGAATLKVVDAGGGPGALIATMFYGDLTAVAINTDDIYVDISGTGRRVWWGAAADTNLRRVAARSLEANAQIATGRALATEGVFSGFVDGDGTHRYRVLADGKTEWGPGNAVRDTNLYRFTVDHLKTDDSFTAAHVLSNGQVSANGQIASYNPSGTGFVHAPATAPGGYFSFGIVKQGDAQWRWFVTDVGTIGWGPGGSTAPDTNLYRSAAGQLQTDGIFRAGGNVYAYGNNVMIGDAGPVGQAGILMSDSSIYRSGAGNLKTNAIFSTGATRVNVGADAGWTVRIGDLGPGGESGIAFGSAADTNLYRVAAGELRSDGVISAKRGDPTYGALGTLITGDTYYRLLIRADGKLLWGAGGAAFPGDAALYRSTAGQLKTDGQFWAVGNVYSNGSFLLNADAGRVYFGAAADTSLYRLGANALATPGSIQAYGATVNGAVGITLNSSLSLWFDDVGQRRVICGPANSGPGGVGRALYIAN